MDGGWGMAMIADQDGADQDDCMWHIYMYTCSEISSDGVIAARCPLDRGGCALAPAGLEPPAPWPLAWLPDPATRSLTPCVVTCGGGGAGVSSVVSSRLCACRAPGHAPGAGPRTRKPITLMGTRTASTLLQGP